MIFTWQNLGQTNVNYNISLGFNKPQAVNHPIINITRSGLIPRDEQGKSNYDEVEVDIYIDIAGFVPVEEPPASMAGDADPSVDDDGVGTEHLDSGDPKPATTGGADDLSTTTATTNSTTNENSMQSDQESASDSSLPARPRLVMRPVTHRLNIKRKKICTRHPAPVHPNTYPPTQSTQRPVLPLQPQPQPQAHPHPPSAGISNTNNKWPGDQVVTHASPATMTTSTSTTTTTTTTTTTGSRGEPVAPSSLEAPTRETIDSTQVGSLPYPLAPSPSRLPAGNLRGLEPEHHKYPLSWPPPFPKAPSTIPKIGPENPLNELLIRQQQQQQSPASQSFMVPILALLSIVISLMLIVVVLLAAASGSSSSFLLNKLNALKCCRLMRRTKGAPASSQARACTGKSLPHGSLVNSLRAGLKSSAASSVSGLSAISGHSQLNAGKLQPSYCFKSGNYSAAGYYYGQQQSSYPNYHQPPTADLLGTGYQCQQQQQHPPQYPIYHIETTTANPAQTTRLIWQSGNGTSPDGFTMDGSYMPLSNHATSRSDDAGSAYQTIY